MGSFLRRLSSLLRLPGDVSSEFAEIDRELQRLHRDVVGIRREVKGRLLQYNLQLGKLTRLVDGGSEQPVRLSTKSVPLELETGDEMPWEATGGGVLDPAGLEWLQLAACGACGGREFTVVNPWNKFLLLRKAPDPDAARYNYAVCHACGILFATRRPSGARFRYLLEHFGEVTGKRGAADVSNPLLNPYPLSPDQKAELRRLAATGAFVSDHLKLTSRDVIPGLFNDRVENSIHLDVIASLAPPKAGARVLEVRSRAGTILEGLRRLFGAEVYAMPIWESQQFLLQEVYEIPASTLIDFERFDIPFEGKFDLIVSNHMLTHVLRPAEFFAVLRSRLRPGGYLYLHNEPDDAEFLRGNQSVIATLNPLHMQAFDQPSLVRVLAANGFRTVFVKARGDLKHMCLARLEEGVAWEPMSAREQIKRVRLYQRARDRAILKLEPVLRPRVAEVWAEAVERGVAEGIVDFDEKGILRLVANK